MKQVFRIKTSLFIISIFFIVFGNALAKDTTKLKYDVYKHTPIQALNSSTRNIQVEETKKGTMSMKPLEDHKLVMIGDLSGGGMRYIPDTLGATNIQIIVNKKVGYTTIAGLMFKNSCIINIWDDGTIEVDKEGIEASTEEGVAYFSKAIDINNKNAVVMVKK